MRPRSQFGIEIMGGVGKGGENQDFPVAGVEGRAGFFRDDLAEGLQLGVAGRIHLPGGGMEGGEAVAVFGEVLFPTDTNGPGPRL